MKVSQWQHYIERKQNNKGWWLTLVWHTAGRSSGGTAGRPPCLPHLFLWLSPPVQTNIELLVQKTVYTISPSSWKHSSPHVRVYIPSIINIPMPGGLINVHVEKVWLTLSLTSVQFSHNFKKRKKQLSNTCKGQLTLPLPARSVHKTLRAPLPRAWRGSRDQHRNPSWH